MTHGESLIGVDLEALSKALGIEIPENSEVEFSIRAIGEAPGESNTCIARVTFVNGRSIGAIRLTKPTQWRLRFIEPLWLGP